MADPESIVLWLTGLSGAGKTTLAEMVADELRRHSRRVEVLDGECIRRGISADLGFTREDRNTHIRRIGFVSTLLARNGVDVIVAAISPYRKIREEVRAAHRSGRFIEVFVDCPIELLIRRDTKGLYRRALSGEISNLTGISDPYEPPARPEMHLRSDLETPRQSFERIVRWLEREGAFRRVVP